MKIFVKAVQIDLMPKTLRKFFALRFGMEDEYE